MAQALAALGVNSSALIATAIPEENIAQSVRNLAQIKAIPASLLNVVDILSHKELLMTEAAVRRAEQLWGKMLSQGGNSASL